MHGSYHPISHNNNSNWTGDGHSDILNVQYESVNESQVDVRKNTALTWEVEG